MNNSVRKSVIYAFADLCAARFEIDGAESMAAVDHNAIANIVDGGNRQELKYGEVAISEYMAETLGLEIGDKIVLWRHPFANPCPTIRTIARIDDNAEGFIQVALCDPLMEELDCDFDGDHIKWSGNKIIVAIAERLEKLCKLAGATTLPAVELTASEETKIAEFDDYSAWFYACGGDVGIQSAKMAAEAALIPFPLPEDPEEALATKCLGGWTVAEVLRGEQQSKLKICKAADECKKGTKDEEKVPFIDRLDETIRKHYAPESHFWAHPEQYQMIKNSSWGIQKVDQYDTWKPLQPTSGSMKFVRQLVMKELTGANFCPPIDTDEESSRYGQLSYIMVDKTDENKHGFLYVPTEEERKNAFIPKESWYIKTGRPKLDNYDWRFSLGNVHKWDWPEEGITIPRRWKPGEENEAFEETTITKENFFDYFTNGFGEACEENDFEGLSFDPNEYTGILNPAIYVTRLRRLVSRKTENLSAPLKKIVVKCDPYLLAVDLIYVFVNRKRKDNPIDWITCRKILFDDIGDYLFSGRTTELVAGDWRAFFNEFGRWL